MKNKKGLASLQGIIITLVIIGILLGIGFLVLEEFRDQSALSDSYNTVINETGLSVNSSTSNVTRSTVTGFNSFSVVACYCNWSAASAGIECPMNTTIVAANYTIDADLGTIVNASTVGFDFVKCTYTYRYAEISYDAINDTINALNEIPSWLAIIVIIAIVGIILAIVFGVLPKAGEDMGSYTGGGSSGTIAEI